MDAKFLPLDQMVRAEYEQNASLLQVICAQFFSFLQRLGCIDVYALCLAVQSGGGGGENLLRCKFLNGANTAYCILALFVVFPLSC